MSHRNGDRGGPPRTIDLGRPVDRVVLIGLWRAEDGRAHGHGHGLGPAAAAPDEPPLEELARLAEAAGAVVLDRITQRREEASARSYLGRGKVGEVARRVEELGANLVVADHDLTPAQGRVLSDEIGVRVLDRSELILDIFAQRARTSVAKAQVELAQLEYLLPRLPHLWEHLSRLGGGIGTRGPGETQLEVDRRRVRERISRLRRTLEKVEGDWEVQRKGAREIFSAALVGYTNSGKSTLMNALTGAGVNVGDRLFETLETTTRVWEPAPGARLLLSDTVGFIRRLPHRLVASFHATLGEVREADLLLHVADAARPDLVQCVATVESVLEEIGAGEKPTVLILNKADRLEDGLALSGISLERPRALTVSALTGQGLGGIARAALEEWEKRELRARVTLPIGASRALAYLHRHGRVEGREAADDVLQVTVRIPPHRLMKLARETEGLRWEAAGATLPAVNPAEPGGPR